MSNQYIVGYLILAHEHPEQLARLIRTLNTNEVIFFIHIDKKSDIRQFKTQVPEGENVIYVKKRFKVYWLGYNMVKATMSLMQTALTSSSICRYYTLLSGADYPIKSNKYILAFFKNSAAQLITTFNLKDQPIWYPKIKNYYFLDNNILNRRGKLHSRARHIYVFLSNFLLQVQRLLPRRRFLPGIQPYGGCQFWSLTSDCLAYVFRFLTGNTEFRRFYALAEGPDEQIIHTILMNSHYSIEIMLIRQEKLWDDCTSPVTEYGDNLRYIDWSMDRERPAILNEKDFEKLLASDHLFARKFHPISSRALLDRIDQEITLKVSGEQV